MAKMLHREPPGRHAPKSPFPRDPIVEKFTRFCASELGKKTMGLETDYLRKELSGCKRILDIGCGIGSAEERLRGLNITGIDSSSALLEEAKRRSGGKFVLGDATRLPFPDASFDAAFMVAALEFIPDCGKALAEAARVLVPGGRLVVMMLNPESDYFKSNFEKEGSYFRNIRHTDCKEMARLASRLFILETEYFLGISNGNVDCGKGTPEDALFVIKGRKP